MIRTYITTAWRFIKRHRSYSIINILGLALGIASCLVIFLIVRNELGYDKFHKKSDRTYRVTLNAIDFNPTVSMAVGVAMRNDFPELEQISQVWFQQSGLVKIGQARFSEKAFAYADEHFTSVFDYQWLAGNAQTALNAPNSIVLTETIAQKYFGDKDPMGQTVNLNNEYDLKVTGLIRDIPPNTHLPFDFLVSLETIKKNLKGAMKEFYWIMGGAYTYIVTPKNFSIDKIQKRIPAFIEKNWGKDIAKEARLPLQPLLDIHFDQRYLNNTISPTTSRETYWGLAAVALFIIIIACINFVNLATAQAMERAKEVGVRKVLGSNRSQLIRQFLGETTFLVLLALALALAAVFIFLPKAAGWLNINISIRQLGDPAVIALLAIITIVIILLAGLYPAFVQSAFRPAESLKSKPPVSFGGMTMRKSLVVVQFAISQILIIGTLIVAYQMNFFKNQDLGFKKEAILTLDIPDGAKKEIMRQQLTADPGVKDISFSSGPPVYNHSFTDFSAPDLGITKGDVTEIKFIDEKYTDLFGLTMLAGEKISKQDEKDTLRNVVINETLMSKLGINDPKDIINKRISVGGPVMVIGVVKDFQSESKHKKRRPCVLAYNTRGFYTACVKIQPGNMNQTVARIDKIWSALFPDNLFKYEFVDEHIASFYTQEEKMYSAFKIFSFIAILIGCLGLYGLVAFAVSRRNKEVGIRKVLGASAIGIVSLFTKEFIVLIAIAFIVAAPVAWYVMHNWLENFAYQVAVGSEIFLISIGVSVVIAVVTISYQAVKAAFVNPVKSLRSE